jgi:hypothetical protein
MEDLRESVKDQVDEWADEAEEVENPVSGC